MSGRRQSQPVALDVFLTQSAFQVGHVGLRAGDDARARSIHGGERSARPGEPWHERCLVERHAQHRAPAGEFGTRPRAARWSTASGSESMPAHQAAGVHHAVTETASGVTPTRRASRPPPPARGQWQEAQWWAARGRDHLDHLSRRRADGGRSPWWGLAGPGPSPSDAATAGCCRARPAAIAGCWGNLRRERRRLRAASAAVSGSLPCGRSDIPRRPATARSMSQATMASRAAGARHDRSSASRRRQRVVVRGGRGCPPVGWSLPRASLVSAPSWASTKGRPTRPSAIAPAPRPGRRGRWFRRRPVSRPPRCVGSRP